ncbi:hypothetical protein FB451DRAFT_1571956 [Mycena latifolia]|nr:hypothetical protein FB451DRAFT_1571956 [Mycena latifolia]
MSGVATSSQLSPSSIPALARTRTPLACSNCRRRKIKVCTPGTEASEGPCARCRRRGLRCEYLTVSEQAEQSTPGPPSQADAHYVRKSPSDAELGHLFPWAQAPLHTGVFAPASPPDYMLFAPPTLHVQPRSITLPLLSSRPDMRGPGFSPLLMDSDAAPSRDMGQYASSPFGSQQWTQPHCPLCPQGMCYCSQRSV